MSEQVPGLNSMSIEQPEVFPLKRKIRGFKLASIRSRLLVTFLLLVLLPALAVGVISTMLNAQQAREQVFQHLDSVSTLKQAEVQTWTENLVSNLMLAMPSLEQAEDTRMILIGSEQGDASQYQGAYDLELERLRNLVTKSQVFDEMFLVNLRGTIVLSTDQSREGINEYGYPYFDRALSSPFVSPQYLSPHLNQRVIIVAAPITGDNEAVKGLLAGRTSLERLGAIMEIKGNLGETGETYLVAVRDLRLLTDSIYPDFIAGETYPIFSEGIQRGADGENARGSYTNYAGVPVFGSFRYLPDLEMVLLAEQGQAEALSAITRSVNINLGIIAGVVVLAIFGALIVARRITNPLDALSQTAEKIAEGNIALDAAVSTEDEVGALATSFNRMTARLRQTLAGLEQQVTERTADLAQRTTYLQTAAEVSQAAASVLDQDELIQQVVELIRERFQLYYVGLFTIDEPGEWAILRAGTGKAGQVMLEREHRIKIGTGMIGWSIANQKSRVALRAELDEARLANPFLPDTRSEAAIPLRSRGRVIGALTVQSNQPDAFDIAAVAVFETMADQVGVALDNARLFAESQAAFETLNRAYGEQIQSGWERRLKFSRGLGYRADASGVVEQQLDWLAEAELVYQKGEPVLGQLPDQPASTSEPDSAPGLLYLGVPVKVRGQVIGVIQGYKPGDGAEWNADEIEFVQDVANIVGITLETARLYEDTTRRAENERIISEVSTRVRESLDVDTVMQTALVELQRALRLKDITIRLGEPND